uniref:Hsp70 family protein n=1 Tax=Rhizophagus irregularis (strain DAOM 181602 / DAOM 197198 / MUCL 43194) TaxID=747089 RepID=U9TWG5_RHIID
MANERSKDDSSEKLFSDKPLKVIEKLGFSYYELNNKFINLLEENQRIKQQCKNLEDKNQENLQKNQEISRINSSLIEKNKEVSRINSELKEKLEEKEKNFKEFQQYVLNLENQRNEELQQLQKLEMMSQSIDKNLGVLKLEEIDENIIKTFKENNEDFLASFSNKNPDESLPYYSNIKVVVGLDFGTTCSGFSYCHVANKQNICSNEIWPGEITQFKTNTVLQYDDKYNDVVLWGASALARKPNRRIKRNKPVELFKLWLGNLDKRLKPRLPVDHKKAITDYLREIGKVIKDKIAWSVNFFENVLLVLSVPAEYSEKDKSIMRKCAYNAGLINVKNSKNLEFITESEAAAIYCMNNKLNELQEYNLGMTLMVVDCGGYTVDLTTRKLVGINPLRLGEVTARIRDYSGSTFIDGGFIEFLRKRLGARAINLLRENNYDQFQFLVQEFCKNVKEPFTGDNREFNYELDIKDIAPGLLQYVDKEIMEMMVENEWMINIKYNDIKLMFDPIIERIIRLIHVQLDNIQEACSAMFLVGGFSENQYFQKRIKQEFNHTVKTFSVPAQPIAAIAHGAVIYGLLLTKSPRTSNEYAFYAACITARVLKYTYGIKVCLDWKKGDSPDRRTPDGKIFKFNPLVKRGTAVEVGKVISLYEHVPLLPCQTEFSFEIYKSSNSDPRYCDETGMECVGKLRIDLPDVHLGYNRPVTFGLSFGDMEISAFAKNNVNGQTYVTSLCLNNDI